MAISDMMRSRSSDKLIAGPARSTSPWIWGMTDSTHHDREERNNYLRRSEGLVTGGQEQEASSETSHCKCLLDTELGGGVGQVGATLRIKPILHFNSFLK